MHMKRFIYRTLLAVAALCTLSAGVLAFAMPVSAQAVTCDSGETHLNSRNGEVPNADKVCCPVGYETSSRNCFIGKYINPTIRILSYIVGVVVVGGMTWGGIQYASSAGDPQKVTKAKQSITKSLVALVTFMVFGAFVQFLSPSNLTNPNVSNCSASHKSAFLGLKTWYAYLPADSFDSKCNVVSNLRIMPTNDKDGVLPNIIVAVVDDLLRIAAIVAVAFVITGGVQYITTQGDPSKVKQAMSTIINALIGLAIAIIAAAVVSFIGSQLAK